MRPALEPLGGAALLRRFAPAPRASSGRASRLLAAAPLVVLLVSGLVVIVAAARNHSYLLPAQKHLARAWVEGPFAAVAHHLSPGVVAADLVVMCLAYLVVVRFANRLPARWVVATVVLATVLFLLAPPLFSTDVFDYVDYARLAVIHHLSPYSHVPAEAPQDAIYPFVHWRHTSAAYGPLFVLGSYPLGLVSPAVGMWVFKAVAAASGLGCCALVWRLAGRLGRSPAEALAVFGLNPLLLVWAVGGAHNDLLMLLLMLGGIVLLAERRPATGAVGMVAAAAIKATAGLAVVFALAGAADRRRVALGTLIAVVVLSAMATVAFPDHTLGLLRVLHHEQGLVSRESLPARLAALSGRHRVSSGVHLAFTLLSAGALAWLLVRTWRGADWLTQLGWAFVVVVVCSSWVVPWYAIWALPLAAVSRRRHLLVATLAVQGYLIAATLIIEHHY